MMIDDANLGTECSAAAGAEGGRRPTGVHSGHSSVLLVFMSVDECSITLLSLFRVSGTLVVLCHFPRFTFLVFSSSSMLTLLRRIRGLTPPARLGKASGDEPIPVVPAEEVFGVLPHDGFPFFRADFPASFRQPFVPPRHRFDADVRWIFVFQRTALAGEEFFCIERTEEQTTGDRDASEFTQNERDEFRLPMFGDLS